MQLAAEQTEQFEVERAMLDQQRRGLAKQQAAQQVEAARLVLLVAAVTVSVLPTLPEQSPLALALLLWLLLEPCQLFERQAPFLWLLFHQVIVLIVRQQS